MKYVLIKHVATLWICEVVRQGLYFCNKFFPRNMKWWRWCEWVILTSVFEYSDLSVITWCDTSLPVLMRENFFIKDLRTQLLPEVANIAPPSLPPALLYWHYLCMILVVVLRQNSRNVNISVFLVPKCVIVLSLNIIEKYNPKLRSICLSVLPIVIGFRSTHQDFTSSFRMNVNSIWPHSLSSQNFFIEDIRSFLPWVPLYDCLLQNRPLNKST
jgi:hypothetical protein